LLEHYPEDHEEFCSKCGEETMVTCTHCSAPIRGQYNIEGAEGSDLGDYEPPAYCHKCGHPFPWTGRRIDAAVELLETGSDVSPEQAQQFRRDLDAVTKDTPSTQAAAYRLKTLMGNIGQSVATRIREIIVDVLSEAAKKRSGAER
jgi:hypothetical protein